MSLVALHIMAQPTASVRTFSVRDGLAANLIAGIDQSPDGLMWIATWNGLCCYDGYRFTTFKGSAWEDNALSTNRIAMIHCTSKGDVWVRTYDGGLYLLDTHHGSRFVNMGLQIERKYGIPIKPRNFYGMTGGHTWITDEEGELTLRISDNHPTDVERMEVFGTKGKPLHGQYVKKVVSDAQGREWLVTDKGMMCYNTGEVRNTIDDSQRTTALDTAMALRLHANGIATTDIGKHFTDRQGNLWFSSSKGLSLVNFRQQRFRQIAIAEGQQTRSVLCRRDGTIWAGTQNGILGIITINDNDNGNDNGNDNENENTKLKTQNLKLKPQTSKFKDRIYALFEDSRGTLWIGTKGEGCWKVEKGGQPIVVPLDCPHIYDFDEDAEGNIWIATFGGGVRIISADGKVTTPANYPNKDFEKVRRITHDNKGTIYVSTTTGLVTITKTGAIKTYQHSQNDTTSLQTSDVMQTLVTRSGDVYVVTLGGGIQRLLPDGKGFASVTGTGERTGNTLSVVEDRQGRLWIVSEAGIDCYQPAGGQLLQYDLAELAVMTELTEAKPAIDSNGRVWLATTGGVITFNPQEMTTSKYCPNIIFTEVQYQGDREAQPILNLPKLIVEKDQRNLTISFAALDYKDNYLMQYAYRMDDGEWNYIGHNPRIAFSDIDPGLHTLTVRSTNCDGVWVGNETTLDIDVTPTLWERTWVRLLALLIVIGVTTAVIIRYLTHRQHVKEREQRLENLIRQYQENVNDNLNVNLNDNENDNEKSNHKAQSSQLTVQSPPQKTYHLEEPKIVDEDDVMMNTLMQFIEEHVSDENLKIDDMAGAVNMGRTMFYEKIRELVGVSPSDFLRQVRMERARQLVARSRMSIAEVAYAVGFTDPKYFSKCFKKETGKTPSEYREHGSELSGA